MTTNYRRPDDPAAVAHNFRVFADADCAHEPLYAALSHAIAADDDTIALTMRAPYSQRRPVLLFASVHDLLLAGVDHPLAAFYRSVVGDAVDTDVERAAPAFRDFCRTHRDAIADSLATRATQTNEIGRAAVLRLALATLGDDRPIALIDVGCSAGLNLLVDRYRFAYRFDDGETVVGPDVEPTIRSDIVSGRPDAARPMPPIARRIGLDRSPLDVRDERDARWLRACVWPSDASRHARLAAALALARDASLDIRSGDAIETLAGALDGIDRDVRPVVFHSWVLSYFDGASRRRFADVVRAMVADRDGAWISGEGPDVVPGLVAPPLPHDADATRREATLWHRTSLRDGVVATDAIARSHPHGRWIEWLAG